MLPVVGGLIAYLVANNPAAVPEQPPTIQTLPSAVLPDLKPEALAVAPVPQPLGETVEFVVRRNDTLDRIFRQLKLDLNDLASIRDLSDVREQLDQLQPGD